MGEYRHDKKIYDGRLIQSASRLTSYFSSSHDRGLRAATINAVAAATKRSMQLGGIPEEDIRHKYNL